MQNANRKRIWFWSLFLSAACAVYVFGIYPRQHMLAQACQTADMLQQRISADPRFGAISVHCTSTGGIFVRGEVQTDADLSALRHLIDDTNLPKTQGISILVSSIPK